MTLLERLKKPHFFTEPVVCISSVPDSPTSFSFFILFSNGIGNNFTILELATSEYDVTLWLCLKFLVKGKYFPGKQAGGVWNKSVICIG